MPEEHPAPDAPPGANNQENLRKVVRGCLIALGVAIALAVGLFVLLWSHMRERMTTDPADTRLLRITAAPSIDAWVDSLEIPLWEREEGIEKRVRETWPDNARFVLFYVDVPILAMRNSTSIEHLQYIAPDDFSIVIPTGERITGAALTNQIDRRQAVSPDFNTQDQMLYPGGFFDVDVIAPLPADSLPGEVELHYRDTPFASVDLPADAGASAVEVVWSDE